MKYALALLKHWRNSPPTRFKPQYSSLIQSYNRNKYVTSTIFNTSKQNNQETNQNEGVFMENLKYLFYVTSGLLLYKLYTEKVEAVSLKGRRNLHNFIADVVEEVSPAVVYIEIKDTRRLEFFSGRPTTVSNGSGFIIKEDGLILTNAHVVTNKPHTKVEVKLFNGKVYSGLVEDIDVQSDLATVRIDAKQLPVMKLGNSSELRPGEFVVALGSPLSLSNTVTSGVVSSTQRGSDELGLHGKDMVYIQTDAAITFGNSGGPLVNLDGEAIGVNSMKVTAGISFAIPIDYVKDFLQNSRGIRQTPSGGPKRRYMGITMLTITPQILHELKQRNDQVPTDLQYGVLVMKVIYGSPAHLGGLNPGDIVTTINDVPVRVAKDVYAIIADGNIRKMNMTIIRHGQKMNVQITPEDIDQFY